MNKSDVDLLRGVWAIVVLGVFFVAIPVLFAATIIWAIGALL
jgi:hypothetical protein